MEAESSAPVAAGEWDQSTGDEVEEKGPDGAVSQAADCAPAAGVEVVCSGEGSHRDGRRRSKRMPNFKQPPPRPEDERCSGCQVKFERQGRRFNRRALCTFTNVYTARWTFPQAAAELQETSFLCETCAQLIRSKYRKRQCGKRTLWTRPMNELQRDTETHLKNKRTGKKSRAAMLVSKSRYKSAFRVLWSARGARKPMMDFISNQLKLEVRPLS
uniref:Uncharacterized protein n=1 Tax=Knipowitschia caucasica TaxID=637954 RepID=A0AAV2MLF6_KNICA